VSFATHADIPWEVYRTNRWRLTEKKHLGRQVKDADGVLEWVRLLFYVQIPIVKQLGVYAMTQRVA